VLTIAADPCHLGTRIGITAVLHSWGSALTHHPHVHMIVPGGGISPDGWRWISSRPVFLLPVRVLGKLFRRLFLTQLVQLFDAGRLRFSGTQAGLAERPAFLRHLAPTRRKPWIVYAKPPFAEPAAVLATLSRYTHRVAISNRRLLALDEHGVNFRYKDYRREVAERHQVMTLGADEFIRRFLLHVLPRGFHRIRHNGLLASGGRRDNLARARGVQPARGFVIRRLSDTCGVRNPSREQPVGSELTITSKRTLTAKRWPAVTAPKLISEMVACLRHADALYPVWDREKRRVAAEGVARWIGQQDWAPPPEPALRSPKSGDFRAA
jgi:hypothetical protein